MLSKIYIRFYILLSFFYRSSNISYLFLKKKKAKHPKTPNSPQTYKKKDFQKKKKKLEASWNFASSEYWFFSLIFYVG